MKKTIVISGVNIRKGGTLSILKSCLAYCASLTDAYRVVAIVHNKNLAFHPEIEYIEMPHTISSWPARLKAEYITMKKISRRLAPVYLWFSLHDTSPFVKADRQAVYCHTSFPFLKWSLRDFKFDYKIPLFALFTGYVYRFNIHSNTYLVVQQNWLRKAFSKSFHIKKEKIIICPPQSDNQQVSHRPPVKNCYTFLYAATADAHKNFETVCRAAALLSQNFAAGTFKVILTLSGNENAYAAWVKKNWGSVKAIDFAGFMPKNVLYQNYEKADCLIFPSRIETWGLPISEFKPYNKPMLLADLPYAHETAAGAKKVVYFNPVDAIALSNYMKNLMLGDESSLQPVPVQHYQQPAAYSWQELFKILLN